MAWIMYHNKYLSQSQVNACDERDGNWAVFCEDILVNFYILLAASISRRYYLIR